MDNKFKYSFNEKRYHTFNYYLKSTYHCKVSKVILDAGFTCPNRDGTKSFGGCTFCSDKGSGDSNAALKEDLINQYEANKKIMDNKWPNALYIPYFQSFSNTYGPLSKIKEMLDPFIHNDEVCEIAIATRCDCLEDDVINYLDSLTNIKTIWIELGLQSSNDNTGKLTNRGHSFKEFTDCIHKLEKTNLKVCVHILNGIPYETIEDMIKTIKDINHLPFDGIKIHMLHIIKNTKMGILHEIKPFKLITREEYINLVVKQLELLRPEVVVQRLTGDPIKENLLAPEWVLNKTTILNDVDKLMRELDTYQGSKYE
ncbi:MAG: TIGR01212 family radical SAM protein [Erysipelotrichaceae bacterium]|nr:TIGR01212 family radical SAM protein [Erysipelotrichaceae bacterium]